MTLLVRVTDLSLGLTPMAYVGVEKTIPEHEKRMLGRGISAIFCLGIDASDDEGIRSILIDGAIRSSNSR